MNTLVEGDR